MTLSLAILISGRGSNMQAIHQAITAKRLNAEIRLILSDQSHALGLQYAAEHDLPHLAVPKLSGTNRRQHEIQLEEKIAESQAQWVVLAGYMRILSADFVARFSGRMLNIHPSLLPAFPGLHAQRQALDAGVRYSGCTVHFVDAGCDTGPIVDQRVVEVLPDDNEAQLSERILRQEHLLYSDCLQRIAEGKIFLEGNRVKYKK